VSAMGRGRMERAGSFVFVVMEGPLPAEAMEENPRP
jgi:hypothetical protein